MSATIRTAVALFAVALTVTLLGMILVGSASAGTGKATFNDFTFTHQVDKASPVLAGSAVPTESGDHRCQPSSAPQSPSSPSLSRGGRVPRVRAGARDRPRGGADTTAHGDGGAVRGVDAPDRDARRDDEGATGPESATKRKLSTSSSSR